MVLGLKNIEDPCFIGIETGEGGLLTVKCQITLQLQRMSKNQDMLDPAVKVVRNMEFRIKIEMTEANNDGKQSYCLA